MEAAGVIVGKICLSVAGWFFCAGGGMAGTRTETQGTGMFMLVIGFILIIAGAFL